MKNRKRPEVSVCIPTYFHEKYIKQAIESVISQHVSFEYEIVISDDCSEDGTQSIILDYSKKCKNLRYYFHKKNIGLTNNMYFARSKCLGKYIVGLSGDDYWIDNNKMQKQYDFLEKHKDYLFVSTRKYLRKENETTNITSIPDAKLGNNDFTLDMYLKGLDYSEHGMMMRNPFLNEQMRKEYAILPKMSPYIDDITHKLLLLIYGKGFILKDVTDVYRQLSKNNESKNFNTINNYLSIFKKTIDNINNLVIYYNDKYDFTIRYKLIMKTGIAGIILNRNFSSFYKTYLTIPKKYRDKHLIIYGFFSLITFSFKKFRLFIKQIIYKPLKNKQ